MGQKLTRAQKNFMEVQRFNTVQKFLVSRSPRVLISPLPFFSVYSSRICCFLFIHTTSQCPFKIENGRKGPFVGTGVWRDYISSSGKTLTNTRASLRGLETQSGKCVVLEDRFHSALEDLIIKHVLKAMLRG